MGGSEELVETEIVQNEIGETSLAVCLVSGGMDSCVTAAIANNENDELAFLHVSYGQRTESRERESFEQIADHYRVKARLVVSLEQLAKIGGSSLTDINIAVAAANLSTPGIPSSYVPFRNAHLLSAAVSWAEVIGAQKIFIGAVEQDSSGYPDCRPAYYQAFNEVIRAGTRDGNIEVITPLIGMRKFEIVRLGLELGAPFDLTWSCYSREKSACGVCDSCVLRLRAFQEAGAEDPIAYEVPVKV